MNTIPSPLTVIQDQEYILAAARCVVDDEIELAKLGLGDGISVPHRIV